MEYPPSTVTVCVYVSISIACAVIFSTHLPIQVLAARREQNSRSHVRILAGSLGGKGFLLLLWHLRLLVVVPALLCSHLTGENARSDAVDADLDAVLRNLSRQHLVQVNRGTLAGVVREVILRDTNVARNGRNVDNGRRPAMLGLGSLLKQRQKGGGLESG
jgi:hypothetical protein